jgi:hypothetical protein
VEPLLSLVAMRADSRIGYSGWYVGYSALEGFTQLKATFNSIVMFLHIDAGCLTATVLKTFELLHMKALNKQ